MIKEIPGAVSETLHPEAEGARPNLAALILMMSPAWMVGFTLTLLAPALPMIVQSLGENGTFKAQMIMIMPSIGMIFGSAVRFPTSSSPARLRQRSAPRVSAMSRHGWDAAVR